MIAHVNAMGANAELVTALMSTPICAGTAETGRLHHNTHRMSAYARESMCLSVQRAYAWPTYPNVKHGKANESIERTSMMLMKFYLVGWLIDLNGIRGILVFGKVGQPSRGAPLYTMWKMHDSPAKA